MTEKPQTRLFFRKSLPHWEVFGKPIFDTLHLKGSIPEKVLVELKNERETKLSKANTKKQIEIVRNQFLRIEKYLDCNPKISWLVEKNIATYICDCFLEGHNRKQYVLHAFVVMPNHIHWLYTSLGKENLITIRNRFKRLTARKINKVIERSGSVWMKEGFDHWIRTGLEFENTINYIERNPVKAGLIKNAKNWKWSSASIKIK